MRPGGQAAWLLVALAAGCGTGGPGPNTQETAGRVEVEWVRLGASTEPVRFGGPAQARWCAGDSLLTVTAVRNDSAIGFLLLATDSSLSGLGSGPYSVMPSRMFTPWRPRAVAALRLVEVVAVRNYESGTGQVEVNGGSFNPLAPFGGYKQSGHGRELGKYGLEEFLEVKALQL